MAHYVALLCRLVLFLQEAPYKDNNSKVKLPKSSKSDYYYDYCPICEGYGSLTLVINNSIHGSGYDCPKCRGLGFLEIRGKNISGHYFQEKVLSDQIFHLQMENPDIKGDINLVDSNGEKFTRGYLDVNLQLSGRGYISGATIEWTYKNDSHEKSINHMVIRGRPFELTLINDEEMLLLIQFQKYYKEKEIQVRVYHKQFERNP